MEGFISGQMNSRTSFVGIFLIFSDLRGGIESSKTQPRRGSKSLVRIISRYRYWSAAAATEAVEEEEEDPPPALALDSMDVILLLLFDSDPEEGLLLTPKAEVSWVTAVKCRCWGGRIFSRIMETAIGPRLSSIPNQFCTASARDERGGKMN